MKFLSVAEKIKENIDELIKTEKMVLKTNNLFKIVGTYYEIHDKGNDYYFTLHIFRIC